MSSPNKTLSYVIKYACVQAQAEHMASLNAGLSATKKAVHISPQEFQEAVKNLGQFLNRGYLHSLAAKGIKNIPKSELEFIKAEADALAATINSMAAAKATSKARWQLPINYVRYLWAANPKYVWKPAVVWGTTGGAIGAGIETGSELASPDTDKNYLSAALRGLLKGVAVGAPVGLGGVVASGLPVYFA